MLHRIITSKIPGALIAIAIVVLGVHAYSMHREIGALGTFRTSSIVVDDHVQSDGLGITTPGNVCGQIASSDWNGPACWNYNALAGDGVHDIIDAEWNTSGANASTSGEQIPFVAHVSGNVDTTAAGSQAIGFQASVHPSKSAGANPLSCAAFQGGAGGAGCDTLYSFKGDGGQLYNRDSLFIGDSLSEGSQIDGNILIDGNTVTFGNVAGGSVVRTISAATFDRSLWVDSAGAGAITPIKDGPLGSSTDPTGADLANIEVFTPNGKNYILMQNSALAGHKGWALYHSTNGANDDLKLYNYNLGTDAIVMRGAGGYEFASTTGTTVYTIAASGHVVTAGTAPTLSSCGTSPTISGTDYAGIVTTGSAATTCTITFAATYTTEPSCILLPAGTATQPVYTVSATAITVTTDIASTKYHYMCVGR